jgi:hypothetical protein
MRTAKARVQLLQLKSASTVFAAVQGGIVYNGCASAAA